MRSQSQAHDCFKMHACIHISRIVLTGCNNMYIIENGTALSVPLSKYRKRLTVAYIGGRGPHGPKYCFRNLLTLDET